MGPGVAGLTCASVCCSMLCLHGMIRSTTALFLVFKKYHNGYRGKDRNTELKLICTLIVFLYRKKERGGKILWQNLKLVMPWVVILRSCFGSYGSTAHHSSGVCEKGGRFPSWEQEKGERDGGERENGGSSIYLKVRPDDLDSSH